MFKNKVAQALSTIVLRSVDSGTLIDIRNGVVVGRGSKCDVVINSAGISRRHAQLIPDKWDVRIKDLGSVNGTYINNKKISGYARAKHKDKIRFDTLEYEVSIIADNQIADNQIVDSHMVGRADGVVRSNRVDLNLNIVPPIPHKLSVVKKSIVSVVGGVAPAVSSQARIPNGLSSGGGLAKAAAKKNWMVNTDKPSGGADTGNNKIMPKHIEHVGVLSKSSNIQCATALMVGLSRALKGKNFSFSANDNQIKWEVGRAESSDVLINDASVSRDHAQLVHDQGRWKIIDLMSANGVYVNGKKCLTSFLQSGDTLRFGKQELLFKTQGKQNFCSSRKLCDGSFWICLIFVALFSTALVAFFSKGL